MQFLESEFGWQRYAQKHYESRFTRFYEGYWMPAKFGYDIRRAHYSSLILTNQMSREEAIEKVKTKPIDEETAKADFEYVATKLGFSVNDFQAIFESKNKSYRDYKNNMFFIDLGIRIMRFLGLERKIIK